MQAARAEKWLQAGGREKGKERIKERRVVCCMNPLQVSHISSYTRDAGAGVLEQQERSRLGAPSDMSPCPRGVIATLDQIWASGRRPCLLKLQLCLMGRGRWPGTLGSATYNIGRSHKVAVFRHDSTYIHGDSEYFQVQRIQGREAIFFERYTELPAFVQFTSNDR